MNVDHIKRHYYITHDDDPPHAAVREVALDHARSAALALEEHYAQGFRVLPRQGPAFGIAETLRDHDLHGRGEAPAPGPAASRMEGDAPERGLRPTERRPFTPPGSIR